MLSFGHSFAFVINDMVHTEAVLMFYYCSVDRLPLLSIAPLDLVAVSFLSWWWRKLANDRSNFHYSSTSMGVIKVREITDETIEFA